MMSVFLGFKDRTLWSGSLNSISRMTSNFMMQMAFAYSFLIGMMGPQLRFSRIGQAVGGVHSSVQRCLLDLRNGVPRGLNSPRIGSKVIVNILGSS